MFWFFGCEACGILIPWPGIEPVPPALEGEVLTTGSQGSPSLISYYKILSIVPCRSLLVIYFIYSSVYMLIPMS